MGVALVSWPDMFSSDDGELDSSGSGSAPSGAGALMATGSRVGSEQGLLSGRASWLWASWLVLGKAAASYSLFVTGL